MKQFLLVGFLALVTAVVWPVAIHAAKGVHIKISAINSFTVDRPQFCLEEEEAGGLAGDKLDVDVFTNLAGITSGTAKFEDAVGNVDILNINNVFLFFGGIVLETAPAPAGDRVAIWLDEAFAPAHVTVEQPAFCENTKSTFTLGVDKLSLMIRFE